MLERNTQVDVGITHIPYEIRQFLEMNSLGDRNLRQVYVQNFSLIHDSKTLNRRSRIYLRYLRHDHAPLIETIAHALEDIFQRQSHAFKINLSFSFILQHPETELVNSVIITPTITTKYSPRLIRNSPRLIRNQQDLKNLLDHLAAKDFPSHLKDQRPNTKWVIERIVSLRIHLVMTTYPLGNPPKLPDYIKNNRYIIALEKDQNHAYRYKDHLCFFRCLDIGTYKFTRHNCNQKAKELFQDYCEHFQVNPQDFKGVELTDFPQLEKYYETQLFAMFLKEDGTAKTLFLSQSSFPTKIYMNVYKNHLSLITDHKMYSKQYICNRCDKLFAETPCIMCVQYIGGCSVYRGVFSTSEGVQYIRGIS